MGSNLKQEAMESVGEVEHAECYYDTDRNKPLPGRAAAPSVDRNSGERAKALNEAWSICIAQDGRARSSSGAARAMACADEIHRLAATPQPVNAAQAVPEGFDLDALANACIECDIPDSTYESLCIALKAAQPTDTTGDEKCTFCGAPWGRYGCTCPKPTDTTKGA
jgi:hypothetical protein